MSPVDTELINLLSIYIPLVVSEPPAIIFYIAYTPTNHYNNKPVENKSHEPFTHTCFEACASHAEHSIFYDKSILALITMP